MIEDGDRVMVCVSGGKDSYALLDMLIDAARARAGRASRSSPSTSTRSSRASRPRCCPSTCAGLGVPSASSSRTPTRSSSASIPEGKTMCSLCSRLRRGVLYRVAGELGATKIALGHHRDDMVATLFLNLFFGGQLKAMPPKLVSDDGRHVVIRPLAYVARARPVRFAEQRAVPDHPVQPVRARRTCSASHRRDAARLGARGSGPHRPHLRCDGARRALASDGSETVSVRSTPTDGRRRRRGRPRLRRRRYGAPGRGRPDRADGDAAFSACRRASRRRGMTRTLAALIAGAALGGCASLNTVDADVSTFGRWPTGRGRRDLCLRAAAVAAGAASATAAARGRGAGGDRNRRPGRRAAEPARPTYGPGRRAHHRNRGLALRRPVLVRRHVSLAPPVRLRPLRPGVWGPYWGPYGARAGSRRLLGLLPTLLRPRGRRPHPRQALGRAAVRGPSAEPGIDDRPDDGAAGDVHRRDEGLPRRRPTNPARVTVEPTRSAARRPAAPGVRAPCLSLSSPASPLRSRASPR